MADCIDGIQHQVCNCKCPRHERSTLLTRRKNRRYEEQNTRALPSSRWDRCSNEFKPPSATGSSNPCTGLSAETSKFSSSAGDEDLDHGTPNAIPFQAQITAFQSQLSFSAHQSTPADMARCHALVQFTPDLREARCHAVARLLGWCTWTGDFGAVRRELDGNGVQLASGFGRVHHFWD